MPSESFDAVRDYHSLNVEATGAECFSEADWKGSDQSEIWDVPRDAELRGDVEQGPIPHDGAEAHIDTAQHSIGVRHDDSAGCVLVR